jgi:hypothetical protein
VKLRLSIAALAAATALVLPANAASADPELRIPNFTHLRSQAVDSVDVTLDGFLMRIARKFAAKAAEGEDSPDAEALGLLEGIQSVRVRNFTFDADGVYSKADIDSVRQQLKGPCWSALVTAHRRDANENVDVYVCFEDDKIKGLAVIASEPREFTIVNIVGTIDIDKFGKLEGQFGIPRVSQNQ